MAEESSVSKQTAEEERREAEAAHRADRTPTKEEERAAEEAARAVDRESVARHAEDMYETGADVRGEGRV